jgi:hypothetical protein
LDERGSGAERRRPLIQTSDFIHRTCACGLRFAAAPAMIPVYVALRRLPAYPEPIAPPGLPGGLAFARVRRRCVICHARAVAVATRAQDTRFSGGAANGLSKPANLEVRRWCGGCS